MGIRNKIATIIINILMFLLFIKSDDGNAN